jgi:uncharacterized protein
MTDAHPSLESDASPPRPVLEKPTSLESSEVTPRRVRRLVFIVQSILLLAHGFLYETWVAFHPSLDSATVTMLRIVFLLAAVSFVIASFLAWRCFNVAVRAFYIICAVWIGFMNFCLFAAAGCWIVLGVVRVAGLPIATDQIANVLLAVAILAGVYGFVNAARVRTSRVTVKLPNLPSAWRGRVAALVSDMHLGHVRNVGFMRRIVARLNQLRPDVVFIAGDMYDGTKANVDKLAEPWSALSVPRGALFITGNHEEFTGRGKYLAAVSKAGVRVVNNQKIDLDGLQIVGVHYSETGDPGHFRAILRSAAIEPERASILLVHAPHRLPIAEEEGISLQVCGHTHGGQFPPGSWIASRVYGPYVHGLNRFGRMLVFTNWGAGTWGPPFRVGTHSQIVLLTFEQS